MRYSALILLVLLTSCSTAHSNIKPYVQEYSKGTQKKAAQEIIQCNCPVIIEFLKDYKVLRDRARA